jgi:hypothetical protein
MRAIESNRIKQSYNVTSKDEENNLFLNISTFSKTQHPSQRNSI